MMQVLAAHTKCIRALTVPTSEPGIMRYRTIGDVGFRPLAPEAGALTTSLSTKFYGLLHLNIEC